MASGRYRRKNNRISLAVLAVVLACALAAGLFFVFNRPAADYYTKLTVESGEDWPEASDFVGEGQYENVSYVSDIEKLQTSRPGSYDVEISANGKTVAVTIEVRDTVAPTGTTKDLTVFSSASVSPEDFLESYSDATDVTVKFETVPSLDEADSREVVILLEDAGGNTTRLTANLTVVLDTAAPEIIGARDLETYVEDTIAYRNGITVVDDQDQNPKLSIDSSKVDLSTPGLYELVYTATDHVGNSTSKTVKVKVYPKKANHVDPEVIYAEADRILSQFITEDMTLREKVGAIYCWTKLHLQYSGKTDKDDWLQSAYQSLKTLKGDCYAFFSINKLFVQRVGATTIDVEKVKNHEKDTRHYWLLVSIDGGETYYHYDNAWSWDLCLVTDKQLDDFSAMVNNCFNRDKSLYPATPTEKLPAVTLPWNDPAIKNAK